MLQSRTIQEGRVEMNTVGRMLVLMMVMVTSMLATALYLTLKERPEPASPRLVTPRSVTLGDTFVTPR